ncbi:hypothetical protein KP509_10G071000 [Ceratopteris richardii]|uniref:Uncharacterized protein n=1 Tax=Ceratopteris richardii TaxID=49495 RepID=A0A8T2U2Z9_CERRI|nr:hypothetical protein KP509_10G071000 [Ceratopteris richardii]
MWHRRLMADFSVGHSSSTTIFSDNQSAFVVARNFMFHAALSTLGCIIIMSRRGSLLGRLAWHMYPRTRTLHTFSQRLCLGRILKLSTKLWAYFLLWSAST